MKPMILVFVIGIAFSVFVVRVGMSAPDAQVVAKPYESAMNYDHDRKVYLTVQNVIDNYSAFRKDGKVYFGFDIHPGRAKYSKIYVDNVTIATLVGESMPLRSQEDKYVFDKNLSTGWYEIGLVIHADNETIPVNNSIYLDK